MSPLKLAFLSLARHRLSTVIAVTAIGIAVACSGILLRLHQVSDSRFSVFGNAGDAIVGAKAGGIDILLNSVNAEGDFPEFLPFQLYRSLQAKETVGHGDGVETTPREIAWIIPFVYFGKLDNYRVAGTEENFFKRHLPDQSLLTSEGRLFTQPGEVVVGSAVAYEKGLNVGDSINAEPWLGEGKTGAAVSLRVVGILEPTSSTWDRLLYTNVEQAHQVFAANLSKIDERSIWGSNVLHYYFMYLYPGSFSPLESLINQRTVGQIVRVDEQVDRLKELSGIGKRIGFFITAFVIFLGGLSVCAMLVTRFEGMSLQLAVLRALGYRKKEIMGWLLWEGLLLGLMGVVVGAVLDGLGFPIFRGLLGTALPPPELIGSTIFNSALIWFVAILATVLSVFVPMLRLSNQDAHSFLKGL